MQSIENTKKSNKKAARGRKKPPYEIAAWVFGSILLIFLISVFFFTPCLSPDQRGILRFLMALAGGLFAFFLVGGVVLEGKVKDLAISAAGGAAIFVLIQFVVNPFPDQRCNPQTSEISTNSNPLVNTNFETPGANANGNTAKLDPEEKEKLDKLKELNKGRITETDQAEPTANNTSANAKTSNVNTEASKPIQEPVIRRVTVIVNVKVLKTNSVTNKKEDVTRTFYMDVTLLTQKGFLEHRTGTTVEFYGVPCGQYVSITYYGGREKKHENYPDIPCDQNPYVINYTFDAG